MKHGLRHVVCLFVALGLLLGGATLAQDEAQSEMPGEGVIVTPAVANWESARPIASIVMDLLGQLGYELEDPSTLANPIFYQSLVQGDVDYWAHSWMPNQSNQLPENFDEEASFAGTIVESGALQGYLVDKASADEFGITSLDDFKREEVKAAFDTDGDGKVDLAACEAGWACAEVVDYHLETYGLTEDINVLDASYTAMFADVLSRFNNGEPVLYYTWTPNSTTVDLPPGEDVVWINVPEIAPTPEQKAMVDTMTVSGVTGAVTDPLKMGFPANDIRIAANNTFLEENPAAAALFEQVKIPLEDIASMTARINEGEDSDDDVMAMAQEWISGHQEEVDGWLEAARAAAQ